MTSKNEIRPGGLLYEPGSPNAHNYLDNLIQEEVSKALNNYDELLEEKLERQKEAILSYVSRMVGSLLANQKQPNRANDALVERLTEICSDGSFNKEAAVVAAIASHYKDVANGALFEILKSVYWKLTP